MQKSDRTVVLARLRELEGWAEYVLLALTRNQDVEPTTMEMLVQELGREALRELRESSWTLFAKLHRMTTLLELSSPGPAMAPGFRHAEDR